MRELPKTSWEEIYKYWDLYCPYGPTILNSPITPVEIHVDYSKENGVFYGYDWLTRDEFYSRKHTVESNVAQFLYFTKPTNKGTIHTLNMLINSNSDEERAAVWIYAFAKELLDNRAEGNAPAYAYQLCDATRDFIAQNFYLWHHAMKKLVPEIFIQHNIYLETEFHSIKAIIELARLNAALILYEYVPVLYTSLKTGETLPDYSVRLDSDLE